MIFNPRSVSDFQLRLTRWVSAIPAPVKLLVAMPLMGVPFRWTAPSPAAQG